MYRMRGFVRILAIAVMTVFAAGSAASAAVTRPGGKLSYRLDILAQSPGITTMSAEDQSVALSLAPEGPGSLMRDAQGRLLVYIRMADLSESSLQELTLAGAEIVHRSDAYQVITANVDIAALPLIEGLPAVLSIQEGLMPLAGGNRFPLSRSQSITPLSTCPNGMSVSEGDTQLKAASARTSFSLSGSGVKVGILSDSYNTYAAAVTHAADDVASGDLPGAGNNCSGQTTEVDVLSDTTPYASYDEGRAMLQIVHDLAPGAALSFATAFNGITSFSDNVRSLRAAGADIIADDFFYYEDPFFQEGPISVAISDVVSAGALYFALAGNHNMVLGGNKVGSYEAPAYRPTACPAGMPVWSGPDCHNFEPISGTNSGSGITIPNNCRLRIDLQWNEPWYGLSDDFDLFLLNDSDSIVASSASNNPTSTFQSPFEFISYTNNSGVSQHYRIVLNRYAGSGTPRIKYIFTQNGNWCPINVQYSVSNNGDIVGPTLYGHSSSRFGLSVGAVPYNNSNAPEGYSSRGPATHYFGPVVNTTPAAAISPDLIQ
ncbi:MAG: hypothetical protein WA610_02380, partial [Thermodesulfovibrionales bacterium]